MNTKHYNIGYLKDTFEMMKEVKEYSYQYFKNVDDGTLLDLGCGTGQDILNMASRFQAKNINFIGIDHDPKMIAQANSNKNGEQNIQFIESNIYPLPFEANTISGVRAERLFQHLPEPELLFKEIARILKPQHPFVIVETDWDSVSFYNLEIETEKEIRKFLTESKIPQGKIAKQFTHALIHNEFKNIGIQIFPLIFHSYQEACTSIWIDKIAEEMRNKKILNEMQYQSLIKDLKTADKLGCFLCSINIIVTFSEK